MNSITSYLVLRSGLDLDAGCPGSAAMIGGHRRSRSVLDGRIVGNGGLHRFQGRRSHAAEVGMGVHDAWTGQGIGTAILTALVDTAARCLGLRRLELTCYVDNAPALALYRRFGFEIEGTHRTYALRDGSYVDAYAMARLGGPDLASLRGNRTEGSAAMGA